MASVDDLNLALDIIQKAGIDAQGRLAQINRMLAEVQTIVDTYAADAKILSNLIAQIQP